MDDLDDVLYSTYTLRKRLVADKFRPRFHFLPPEGRWNDLNGMQYWKGRYHIGYLQKIRNQPGELDFSSWQHVSSRDLLHWTYHPPYMDEPLEGSRGDYFNSGDAAEGVDVPTIIANMPRRGICIYQCRDERLDEWIPLAENPVIPIDADLPECVVFDPFIWKESSTYYMLMGNRNYRPGYEGDSTSILRSDDLKTWKYLGPFYKSDRKWTGVEEDCACADFFPFGSKHMLLMHTHGPYAKCQYYIGRYENERFHPEVNGQLSRLGSGVFGPETLIDDRGRRIFMASVSESRDYRKTGWQVIMTLPWHFYPGPDNELKISPVEELQGLRYNGRDVPDITLEAGDSVTVEELSSDCMEATLRMVSHGARQFGFELFCSPDQEERTVVTYDATRQAFVVDFERSSMDAELIYPGFSPPHPASTNGTMPPSDAGRESPREQVVPYACEPGARLEFDIFVDRSVIEIFVNSDICIVQRVYPVRSDSKQFKFFAVDGEVAVENVHAWDMDATNAW